ncbi:MULTISPECIES: AAA family ATPase [Legionella]|uniref:AAA family ATPase n=1 Tax=Legionella resiliens TaxID=2905958 RepID=A0ABS8X4H9_9GAMM|nr:MULTISPECIES: AAA family ATPase [unclassified Legionella]MCE0723432.1 AAA family ATPase [Legionella sp. 9fVS26]MCE3532586.1 AAA family ATPase [Legionella sp. 8cVS16]QLZ68719.1 Uridine kinase [Legionella sp. PC1000]
MATILGISGVSGAGKSTLAATLAKELGAVLISWDEFDEISIAPEDYVDWYQRGHDYREWNYGELAKILQLLKLGHSTLHPITQEALKPTEFIIFDAPLGRLHQQTGQYIDLCMHIEVPLDISLCRRILRDFKEETREKKELLDELMFYLDEARPLFFDEQLKKNADLILNGEYATDLQVQLILQFLNQGNRECKQILLLS